jgi:hypothetical protein
MLQQEAIKQAKLLDGYVPVEVIAGALSSKDRVNTFWTLPEDDLEVGKVIQIFNSKWVIQVVNFRPFDNGNVTIFVVPLE